MQCNAMQCNALYLKVMDSKALSNAIQYNGFLGTYTVQYNIKWSNLSYMYI